MTAFVRLALLSVLALAACREEEEAAAPAAPRPVVSVILDANQIAGRAFTGTVVSPNETDLGFQTLGRLIERTVSLGDQVRRGDVLARLDPEDFESSERSAGAQVSAAEAQLKTAESAAERARALVERGVAPPTRAENAERDLIAARASLDQARAGLVQARDASSYATLTAPRDGIVVSTYVDVGTVVAAGEPVLRLDGTEGREVLVDMPEVNVEGLGPQTRFRIALADDRQAVVMARLGEISPDVDPATRSRRVRLRLEEVPPDFRIGALVEVTLSGGAGEALILPESAVRTDGARPSVWRVSRGDDGATVALVPVATEPVGQGYLRIVSGAAAGEEIVVKGIHSLTEGQQVGARVQ